MISEKLFFVICLLVFLLYRYVYGLENGIQDQLSLTEIGQVSANDEHDAILSNLHDGQEFAAKIKDYPFELVLLSDGLIPVCSAILLTYQWAILPYHCAAILDDEAKYNREKRFAIWAGQTEWTNSDEFKYESEKHKMVQIEKIVHHPHYGPQTKKRPDLSLIKFINQMPDYVDEIKPACLLASEKEVKPEYNDFELIGYGKRDFGKYSSHFLQKMQADARTSKPEPNYPRNHDELVVEITKTTSACLRDPGISLVHNSEGSKYVIGILSYNDDSFSNHRDCEKERSVSDRLVFTRLSYYIDWINDTIADGSSKLCLKIKK